MKLEPDHKQRIQQAKEAAKNPNLLGKCVLFDGGMLGKDKEK